MSPVLVPIVGLRSLCSRLFGFEFSSQSANASRARFRHPTESGTKEVVFLFTFQPESDDFLVELTKFFGRTPPLGKSFSERGTLTSRDARAMEAGDGIPSDVAFRIKGPIGGNEDHRSVRRDVDGELEQKRLIVLHAIEIPSQAEGIEGCLEDLAAPCKIYGSGWTQVSFASHGATYHALVVLIQFNLECCFDLRPLGLKLRITEHGEFGLRKLGVGSNHIFIATFDDIELVSGDRMADVFIGCLWQQLKKETKAGAQWLSLFCRLQTIGQHLLNLEGPERGRYEDPFIKTAEQGSLFLL